MANTQACFSKSPRPRAGAGTAGLELLRVAVSWSYTFASLLIALIDCLRAQQLERASYSIGQE